MASMASWGHHRPEGWQHLRLCHPGLASLGASPLPSSLPPSSFPSLHIGLLPLGPSPGPALAHPHLLSQAPVTFFDSTPTGRILNRFSSDVACADDSLPFMLNILLANAAGLLGLLAVLGAGLPWLLLLLPPLSVLYDRVQRRYRASSRELRRLGSLTLSPLYAHMADTLAGLPVLRAAGATCRCVRSRGGDKMTPRGRAGPGL